MHDKRVRHGRSASLLHTVWKNLRRLVARGVHLDPAWADFNAFRAWARAAGYRPGYWLRRRVSAAGYTPENCYWRPARRRRERRSTPTAWTAWGETKSAAAWSRDRRCRVGYQLLMARVRLRGWPPQKAIETPRRNWTRRTHTAFGETRQLAAWLSDPRCVVGYNLLNNRLQDGWTLEEALTTPLRAKAA
jgi:hypothetical protein